MKDLSGLNENELWQEIDTLSRKVQNKVATIHELDRLEEAIRYTDKFNFFRNDVALLWKTAKSNHQTSNYVNSLISIDL